MGKRNDLEIVEMEILKIKNEIKNELTRKRFMNPRAVVAKAKGKKTLIFSSVQKAGKAKNENGKKFFPSAIYRVCNGNLKSHCGYKWSFLEKNKTTMNENWKKRYEKHSINRKDFKILCEKKGGFFEDFKETYSGVKKGNNKKYYYEEITNEKE